MDSIFHQMKPGLILVVLAVILSSLMLGVAFSSSYQNDISPLTQTAEANQAHSSSYCSSLCAERKANRHYRRSYFCTHLNYICHVSVNVVTWNWFPQTWGWSQVIGTRCRFVTWVTGQRIEFSCRQISGGGQIRKSNGAWAGQPWGPR